MTRTRIALVAGVALVGVAGYALWRATNRPEPDAIAPTVVDDASRTTTSSAITPAPALPGPPPEREPHEAPPLVTPADAALDAAVMKTGLDELHGRIHEAVAPCFAKSTGTDRRIAFRYRLVVANKRASIEEPKIYEASFALGDAEACFEKQLEKLAWDLEMPDLSTPVQDEFSGSEL